MVPGLIEGKWGDGGRREGGETLSGGGHEFRKTEPEERLHRCFLAPNAFSKPPPEKEGKRKPERGTKTGTKSDGERTIKVAEQALNVYADRGTERRERHMPNERKRGGEKKGKGGEQVFHVGHEKERRRRHVACGIQYAK